MRINRGEFGNRFENHDLIRPVIRLEFFRHDKREKSTLPATEASRDDDAQMVLGPEGRLHAQEIGRGKNPNVRRALALASNRDRTVDTALRQMFSQEDKITPEMSLEEVKEKSKLPYGKKYRQIEELDFNFDENSEFRRIVDEHVFGTRDYISFLFHESDKLAADLGDKKSTTYSKQAANVAKIITKYAKSLTGLSNMMNEKKEEYQDDPEIQRFLGTHAGIQESFLLKVIDKLEGRQSAEEFIKSLPDKNGFGFSEGTTVIITHGEKGPEITLQYQDKKWELSQELLDEIINEN